MESSGGTQSLLLPEVGEDFEIGAGGFGDFFRVAVVDCGEIDEIVADAEGAGSGLHEACGGVEGDAAGGNEL